MIISRTPYRISLFGGGTDYQEYFLKYTGCVMTTAITKYCYVGVEDGRIWEWHSIPTGCGMGTSSAFTVGLLKAITEMNNEDIASHATNWELEKQSGNIGFQDQYICAMGGFKRLRFYGSGIISEELDMGWLENYLMLFDTGIYRQGGQIIANQLARIEQNTKLLYELKELALQDYETCQQIGDALHRAWTLKRSLSSDISNKTIDNYYNMAIEAGAVGGKLLGGGGGGFMVFVVPYGKENDVREALKLKQIEFKFAQRGTEIIFRD